MSDLLPYWPTHSILREHELDAQCITPIPESPQGQAHVTGHDAHQEQVGGEDGAGFGADTIFSGCPAWMPPHISNGLEVLRVPINGLRVREIHGPQQPKD